jgi:hypothetical protein
VHHQHGSVVDRPMALVINASHQRRARHGSTRSTST